MGQAQADVFTDVIFIYVLKDSAGMCDCQLDLFESSFPQNPLLTIVPT